jgi:lipoprotein NlpD
MFYIVKLKDTLYSIGKKSGHNYHELAKFNFIKKPDKIIIGQKIWIGDILIHKNIDHCSIIDSDDNTSNKYNSCNFILENSWKKLNFLNKNKKLTKICFSCNLESKKNHDILQLKSFTKHWFWPIKSVHIQYFHESRLEGNKNIEIFGYKGQPVFAAEAGEVVYITDLFEKYGRLVIIKHDANYFSVYAFNNSVLVKQKEKVYPQQQIATMGLSPETNAPRLYFDIRYKGESINPLKVLPNINK